MNIPRPDIIDLLAFFLLPLIYHILLSLFCIIGEVKLLVSGVLSRSPRNILEMRAMAGEEGMVTFPPQEADDP